MKPEDRQEWTPEERRALDALPREEAPPAWLEDRVVSDLRGRGLIAAASTRRSRSLLAGALAACLATFAAGLALGTRWDRREAIPPPSIPRFVLFLYENADYEAPAPGEKARRVEEYRSWARALRDRGALVDGEKLKDAGRLIAGTGEWTSVKDGVAPAEEGVLAGYFIVSARDAAAALAIARDCPHLKHRGRIAVREIDPV